ncbi:MAG: HlyD family efflux transporter periplasmic adaptor subunit, partial [Myxococcota bacterium]
VDIALAGRVVASELAVGARVERGQLLLALDSTDIDLRRAEMRARLDGLDQRIAAVEAEILARGEALAASLEVAQSRVSEAEAQRRESQAAAAQAVRDGARAEKLHRAGVVPAAESERASAAREQSEAAAVARGQTVLRIARESRREQAERRAEQAELERMATGLRAERASAQAAQARLDDERERHQVRAPIAGTLGQVRAPRVGSMVAAGQTVAVVAPDGEFKIAADFVPAEAVGRIAAGQPAEMRATGFPWSQYGTVRATVTDISSEVEDGYIRVELALDAIASTAIPIGHGLTGTVEVQLDQISPATLVLRAAGRMVAEPARVDQRPDQSGGD